MHSLAKCAAAAEMQTTSAAGPMQVQLVTPTTPADIPFSVRTPSEDTDTEMNEMLPEDYVLLLESTPVWVIPDDDPDEGDKQESIQEVKYKKMRVEPPSSASTASPSPTSSPCLSPLPDLDYSHMTEDEIRDRLGVAGTDIAMDWEKEELLATLMEIEKELSRLEM
ncbi:unnamed protein product [Effrenium voratum]|uniref:Uncharacterized protein n=1 Tax=Effrenium voratum TaxID=2562239 RepID=A0AA36IP96_9DINO|nr:unnamed protein product [Effrenium voratum]CAJ1438078.1 unnamed protein product [Effrenium voratum]